jgi:hypothetical protein
MVIIMPAVVAELQIILFLPLLLVPVVSAEADEAPERIRQVQHSRLLQVT